MMIRPDSVPINNERLERLTAASSNPFIGLERLTLDSTDGAELEDVDLPKLNNFPGNSEQVDTSESFWGVLNLPLSATTEELFMAGYGANAKARGGVALDTENNILDRTIQKDCEALLVDKLLQSDRDSYPAKWRPEQYAHVISTIRFPERPHDLGRMWFASEQRGKALRAESPAETEIRQHAPVQYVIDAEIDGEAVRVYHFLANARNVRGAAVATDGAITVALPEPLDERERTSRKALYDPLVVTELCVVVPAGPAVKDANYKPPVPNYNILYSPAAFALARESLLSEGANVLDSALHLHLVETVQVGVLDYLKKAEEMGLVQRDEFDTPFTLDSIDPFPGAKSKNELLVRCSSGSKNYEFKSILHIWFPEDAGLSNPYKKNDVKETPYTVRCASDLLPSSSSARW